MGARENKCQTSQNDILHMKLSKFHLCFHNSCEISYYYIFSGSHRKFSLVLLQITNCYDDGFRLIIKTSALILRNPQMAVNIKDLYWNSGHRFQRVNIIAKIFNKKHSSPYLLGLFLLVVWLFSRSDAILRRFSN